MLVKRVIKELKKNNWKPNQTNRWNFYHFLRKIKRELNISKNVELSPHTFRRAFTTYHANSRMPLPLLQKLLGHSSIRTTALYWRDIYGDDDAGDILTGKEWLEKNPLIFDKNKELPIGENFSQLKNLKLIGDKPTFIEEKPPIESNSLPLIKIEPKPTITNYQPKSLKGLYQKSLQSFPKPCISEISPKPQIKISEQLPVITSQRENLTKEEVLLEKIKQLEEQLAKVQTENNLLKLENKHLKALIRQEQETEAKILQPLSFKSF